MSLFKAYVPDELLAQPRFHECLTTSVESLLATHREIPREVRYLADLRKWLLSQATFVLHFEHKSDPTCPPISPSALLRLLSGTAIASRNTVIASRNTVIAFLGELGYYRLIEPAAAGDRRRKAFVAPPHSEDLIRRWYGTHLHALDVMDGGARAAALDASPHLIDRAQPAMARLLLADAGWYDPPCSVGLFTRAESGSNVIHDLVSRAPWRWGGERVPVGPVSSNGISGRYLISQSHTARILARARDAGLIGWDRPGNRGDCWVSPQLVEDYRRWQALKFAAVSKSFRMAQQAPAG